MYLNLLLIKYLQKISGNKFNEKISEKLTYKNKIKKTEINKIFSVNDKLPKRYKFFNNFEKLKIYTTLSNSKNLSKLIKNIVNNK